jgi:uncharacterized protein (DUF2164 family)
MFKIINPKKFSLFILTVTAVILAIAGAVFFRCSQSPKIGPETESQPAAGGVPIPMRIFINTSGQSLPDIDGKSFTSGEWAHVSEEWFQKNSAELKKYPDLKEARTILEEKLAGVSEENMSKIIRENSLQNFAQGLKDAAAEYHESVPEIAEKILKLVPYGK